MRRNIDCEYRSHTTLMGNEIDGLAVGSPGDLID